MRKNGKTNAVGRGGALLRPADCTVFTEIPGEFVASQQADRVVRPYREQGCKRLFVGADDSVGPLRSYKFAVDSRKNGAFCRADVGIGPYTRMRGSL